MLTISNNYLSPIFQGTISLYNHRSDRSLAVGSHEQKGICSLRWMGCIDSIFSQTQTNVGALCSKTFARRFSYLRFASYAIMPGLYYLSKSIENSTHTHIKSTIDFIFAHLPDITLIAGLVQNVVCLYFGIDLSKNMIQLSFSIWQILEQGLSLDRPTENHGPLFRYKEGKVVRFYDKILSPICNWSYLPITLVHGSSINKIQALFISFLKLFSYMQSDVCSKKTITADKKISRSLKNFRDFSITEKFFQTFDLKDQFPTMSLSSLRESAQKLLKEDASLEADHRSILEGLIGTSNNHGSLYHHMITSKTKKEESEIEPEIKNIFGMLHNNYAKFKKHLINRNEQFLCRDAFAKTIKELNLEINLNQETSNAFTKVDDQNSAVIHSGIQLILQQMRNRTAQAIIGKPSQAIKTYIEQLIKKESDLDTSNWQLKMCSLAKRNALYHLEKFSSLILKTPLNQHQFNLYIYSFGKELGLTFYEDAKKDHEFSSQGDPLASTIFHPQSFILKKIWEVFRYQIVEAYLKEWEGELIDAICNPYDTRLDIRNVIGLTIQIADNSVKEEIEDQGEEVYNLYMEFMQLETPNNQLYQNYLKKAQPFIKNYLPLVLKDLGYITLPSI